MTMATGWLVREDENWELCTDTSFHKTVPDVTQSQQGEKEEEKKKIEVGTQAQRQVFQRGYLIKGSQNMGTFGLGSII